MNHTITFNDFELQQLEGILIQPKRDGDGYSVHRIDKQKQEETWGEWVDRIRGSFDKAQENKETVERLRYALNNANDASAHWYKEYLKTCDKVNDIQAELEEKDNQIEKLRENCKYSEEKADDLQTKLNITEELAAAWKKRYKELNNTLNMQNCSDQIKMHHAGILSKSGRLDEFKSNNHFDIWEVRFSDHKTLNRIFKDYFLVDNDSEYEVNELIKGIESAFRKFNREHELSMFEFFVYLGYFHFVRRLDALTYKALFNTKWTESNPFDCNLNIAPPCGEDDDTVSYYIVFSTAPKYVGDEN